MGFSTESLARFSARRPWLVIAIWILAAVGAGFAGSRWLADALTTDFKFTNRPDSVVGQDLLEDRLRGERKIIEYLTVRSSQFTVDTPAFEAEVRRLQNALIGLGPDKVEAVSTFYDTQDPSSISNSRKAMLLAVVMTGKIDVADGHIGEVRELLDPAGANGFEHHILGPASLSEDFTTLSEEDLRKGEGFGIIVALLVLLVVFGAAVAAILPIGLALLGISLALGAIAVMGRVGDFSFVFFISNMVTMMGLAVGIDYCLFIVSRYREERHKGREKLEAIASAGSTASRAVFFSGMTVVLALGGMMIVPTNVFRALATGAILVVTMSVAAALTLLPALLSLLGDGINRLRVRKSVGGPKVGGFWDRITARVTSRPVTSLVVAAGILLAAGSSFFGIKTGSSGISDVPNEVASKKAFLVLSEEFSGGAASPVEIVIDADRATAAPIAERLQAALDDSGSFGPSATVTNEIGNLTLVSAPVLGDPTSDASIKAVKHLRTDLVPIALAGSSTKVYVSGDTAFNLDFFELVDRYTPWVLAFVLGLSFLLLTVVFRSIVVPIKAILLNLLSVGAAIGLVVLVFQKGVGADLLGFTQVVRIEAWLPLFLFSILFGLSMDYEVFLLTRIRERYDQTRDNAESVAHGLRTTGAIITGAALIMVAVFAGFAAGQLVPLQQMGFGLAVAVFMDATIVRSVLVPATMKLLGDRNWYLPPFLRWLPDLKVEGEHAKEGGMVMEPETA